MSEALRRSYREALVVLADPRDEAAKLEAAYHAVLAADDAGVLEPEARGAALAVLLRMANPEEADRRFPFREFGRDRAACGDHRSLIYQLPRVRTDADRHELLAQHRAWGEAATTRAAADPVTPAPRGRRGRPRVALVSSDLRIHVVGAFADPLIEYAAEAGVELYCYSTFPGAPDGFQQHAAARAAGFRHLPGASARELAQAVAADAPDVAIEIGGSTNLNPLEAFAHRLAPVQASWLGYPHSSGLPTIDRLVLDPYLAPTEPDLVLETPLVLPHSWIALSDGYFRDGLPIGRELPADRKGHLTFGTAASTYKYSAATLSAWAKVLAAVPGSRFVFVRPEGAAPAFRANVAAAFATEGVSEGRLEFIPVRGTHLAHYAEIDICLDTLPLAGGTTTCEALWMGALVVTLAGPAVYERLGASILINAGLADLVTASVEGYVARAVALAGHLERLRAWRAEGRAQMRAGHLGDMRRFAEDFFSGLLSKP